VLIPLLIPEEGRKIDDGFWRRLRTVIDPRPPRFRHDEIVRIVGTTGKETNSRYEPFDASPWIGDEVRVEGAEPTADQREWLIGVWVELPESVEELAVVDQVFFAEDSLESTGLVWVGWDEGGEPRRRPFDPATKPGWRNQIGVSLVPDLTEEEAGRKRMLDWIHDSPDERTGAIEIGWNARAALAARVEADEEPEIEFDYWLHDEDDDAAQFGIALTVYPTGDGWAAFERLVSEPAQGWEHDLGEAKVWSTAFYSRWRRPVGGQAVFLAPGISEAKVVCQYWSSPERPWLRDAPSR
jgi:hypothetical protein